MPPFQIIGHFGFSRKFRTTYNLEMGEYILRQHNPFLCQQKLNNTSYLPQRTKRFVLWYATVRLQRRKVKPRSAPAGRHLRTSPLTPLSMHTNETNMLRFNESPTNPAKKEVMGQLSAQHGIPETPNTLAWYNQKSRILPQNLKAWINLSYPFRQF